MVASVFSSVFSFLQAVKTKTRQKTVKKVLIKFKNQNLKAKDTHSIIQSIAKKKLQSK